jgi:hypothetical protein
MDETVDPPVPISMSPAERAALKRRQDKWVVKDNICFSTLMKALIKNPKTTRMIEAGNFSHAFQIIKVLDRRYNTHDQAAKSALTLAFHSLKQETGESGAEFVDRINAAAMKLEKAEEVVSDAAKLTRLIHPNQGSGSMYDKLGMTIYTTPNITFDKASGLFEGMEHAGLAPVPPLLTRLITPTLKPKVVPPTSESSTENLIKRNLTQGLRTPVDRDLSRPARTSSPETLKENVQFATIRITLLISVPILTRLDPL